MTEINVTIPAASDEVTLSFHEIKYDVDIKKSIFGCQKPETKSILKNIR